MLTAILIIFIVLLVIYYCRNDQLLPPGPRGLPFFGTTPLLRELTKELNGQHLAMAKLAEDYKTNVLSLRFGLQPVIVVFSPKLVKEVLLRDEFVGRPDTFFFRLRCFGGRRGVTFVDGELWRHQRGFTFHTLHKLGMGQQRMEDLIINQVNEIIQEFSQEKGPQSIIHVLSSSIIRILWEVAAGARLGRKDSQLLRLLDVLSLRNRAFDMSGGLLNQFPWLRFIAPEWTGFNLLTELNAQMRDFLMEVVLQHRNTYKKEETRDLIDAFLFEANSCSPEAHIFTDEQLLMVLTDLFLGGASSTSTTLDFAFLLMVKYPEAQEKVYQEIIEHFGQRIAPCYADRLKLPYTTAVLWEAQRLCTVIPITGPRRALKDTMLGGYFIPKDHTILISNWSVHMDESLFPCPNEFRPERFLNAASRSELIENVIPFGLGKRRCLGESLAKPCIFLIFVGILRMFKIETPPAEESPSLQPTPGIILTPRPYNVIFKARQFKE